MDISKLKLPSFFRLPSEVVSTIKLQPGAMYLSEDTEVLQIDGDAGRISLSPVREIVDEDGLLTASPAYLYITGSGSLYIHSGDTWHKFVPEATDIKSFVYQFEVSERVDTIGFTAVALGVKDHPEFDVLDGNGTNITNSDWLTRKWEDDVYTLTYSGGWPVGTYFLKISYAGRVKEPTTSADKVIISSDAKYFSNLSTEEALQRIGELLEGVNQG